MSKRRDLESLSDRVGIIPLSVAGPAWELGRIAGIGESAGRARIWHTDMEDNWRCIVLQRDSTVEDLRAHARKLKRRLK